MIDRISGEGALAKKAQVGLRHLYLCSALYARGPWPRKRRWAWQRSNACLSHALPSLRSAGTNHASPANCLSVIS